MNETKVEMIDVTEDKEPIYFAPKRASLIADIASVISWLVLVGFLGTVVVEIISLSGQIKTQGLALADLLRESSFIAYIFVNIIVPFMTGLGLFGILQAAAMGLNMLLEVTYNAGEAKDKVKA